ncbi:MAG TPA: SRPBCC family protein [Candidatus Limnocylindria bacterium]|nr:SRPBCC family protein [Candidatus Limnocylindria bacterium]
MKRVERSITIAAPADRVFDVASSLDDLPRWQSGIVSARQTSAGPVSVGATALIVRELMGQRLEVPLTVTTYEPPRLLQLHTEVSGVAADASIAVEETDATTSRVTFAMEIRGSGFTSFMEPMVASAADGDIGTSLKRLKEQLETTSQ